MADPAAQRWVTNRIQARLTRRSSEIPGDAVFLPIAIACGGKIAGFILEGIDRLGLGRWIVAPVLGLLKGFRGFGFLFGHIDKMRELALGFKEE